MCLAVPGKIISVQGDALRRVGRVSFGGVVKEVSLAYVPEAVIDDYVIVHVGFAISKLDPYEAEETLHYLERIAKQETAKQETAEQKTRRITETPLR